MELQSVSVEQAKILKDLGFPQDLPMYDELRIINGKVRCIAINKYRVGTEVIYAPSLELTAKWLREKGFYMSIDFCTKSKWTSFCEYIKKNRTVYGGYIHNAQDDYWDSYEEALSASIDRALEVISLNNK